MKELQANQFNDDKRMQHEKEMKSADLKIKEMEITSKEKISKEKPKTK
jgi:hypothetical protein